MLPAAIVAHQMPGRLRVRVEERRRDEEWFARVTRHLRECPTVLDVAATPVTGSILISHEGTDIGIIRSYAQTLELFDVTISSVQHDAGERPPDVVIRSGLSRVDRWMRRESGDGSNLRSVAMVGLLGAAVWQALRGHALPAGATLVWYALALSRYREKVGRDPELDAVVSTADAGVGDE